MAAANATSDPTPEWLNREFVADILSQEEGRPVTVHGLRVAPAVGVGENFGSLLFRVGVDYDLEDAAGDSPKTTSLIVKSLPCGEDIEQVEKVFRPFPREEKMYSSTIPALEALLNEHSPEKVALVPKALPCKRKHTIVLEDLKELGFRMCSRHIGMDLEQTTMVLRNLARFHAASVALHDKNPEDIERYTEILDTPGKREEMKRLFPRSIESVAKAVELWDDPQFMGCADRIRNFGKTAVDTIMEKLKPSKTFLNVLNHGDCWVNNNLFRYSEENGKLAEMRLIDFQLMRYASPTHDLQLFLYTSVQADVREEHWGTLLDTYVEQLRETLTALGHGDKAITRDALEADFELRASCGLVTCLMILRLIVAEPSDSNDTDNVSKEDMEKEDVPPFEKMAAGKQFNSALQRLLPWFMKKKVL